MKKRNKRITIMFTICIIAGLATVGGIVVYARTEPSRAVGRAVLQMSEEFNERTQNSPLQAINLLRNTNGTINIHYTQYCQLENTRTDLCETEVSISSKKGHSFTEKGPAFYKKRSNILRKRTT